MAGRNLNAVVGNDYSNVISLCADVWRSARIVAEPSVNDELPPLPSDAEYKAQYLRSKFGISCRDAYDNRYHKVRADVTRDQWNSIWEIAVASVTPNVNEELVSALNAFVTHFGMDYDEWTKPTFDQANAAIQRAEAAKKESGE